MKIAPQSSDEFARLTALKNYDILDTEPDVALDAVVELASYICKTPIAAISLIDENRQWFKASSGLDVTETSRDFSFCSHAILQDEIMIVPDTLQDERFIDNPLVTSAPGIRFYAGVPIITSEGQHLGTLCVIDCIPRELCKEQLNAINILASYVMTHLDLRLFNKIAQQHNERLQQTQLQMQESHNLLTKLSQQVPGVIYQFRLYPDGHSSFPYASNGIRDVYGVDPEDVREDASPVFAILHPDDYHGVVASINESAKSMQPWSLEYRVNHPVKGVLWLSGQARPEKIDDGSILWHGFITDITVNKIAEKEIEHLAFYDHLTHLPNRRLLLDRLTRALAASSRSGRDGAMLFIDLDHFKTLNDSLGHAIGDLLLQQVAERLTSCMRENDTIGRLARLGGDEFVVMLEDLSEREIEAAAQAEIVGNKILAILNQPYQLATHEYQSTASIGVALFNGHDQSQDDLLKHADIAMYQAKKSGRNTMRFFDPKMQEAINVRIDLERELRKALEKEQFQLYYQVQVDHLDQPTGAEALIRWLNPERGMVSPFHFIPLAEETGLILQIGQWVLDTACCQIRKWQTQASTRNLTLSINVSAKQFYQADFAEKVQTAVKRHDIDPMRLKLELTESILLEHIEETILTMNTLKDIGIRFSLDDFGTGYSSLQYLKRLPLYQLKIDQSFVRDIPTDSSDKAIVRTIIAMARSMDLEVIAEGVETEEQRELLLHNGCTRYQGYLFGRPVPIEQFEIALKQENFFGGDGLLGEIF